MRPAATATATANTLMRRTRLSTRVSPFGRPSDTSVGPREGATGSPSVVEALEVSYSDIISPYHKAPLLLAHVKPETQEHQPADYIQHPDEQRPQGGQADPVGHAGAELPADEHPGDDEEENAQELRVVASEHLEQRGGQADQRGTQAGGEDQRHRGAHGLGRAVTALMPRGGREDHLPYPDGNEAGEKPPEGRHPPIDPRAPGGRRGAPVPQKPEQHPRGVGKHKK